MNNHNPDHHKKVLIYGASGHAKVIADILLKQNQPPIAFLDDNPSLWGTTLMGFPIWGGAHYLIHSIPPQEYHIIIGIGANHSRKKIHQLCHSHGFQFATAIHPSCQLGYGVTINQGTVIMANCAINVATSIGQHCIINTGVTIDHDCSIQDFVHISPGAHLGGSVLVKHSSWIGLGSSIINNITIGELSTIGAGTVVIRDVKPNTTMIGNPAKPLEKKPTK